MVRGGWGKKGMRSRKIRLMCRNGYHRSGMIAGTEKKKGTGGGVGMAREDVDRDCGRDGKSPHHGFRETARKQEDGYDLQPAAFRREGHGMVPANWPEERKAHGVCASGGQTAGRSGRASGGWG